MIITAGASRVGVTIPKCATEPGKCPRWHHRRPPPVNIPDQPEFAACRRKPTVLPGNRPGALSSRPRPSKTFVVSGATTPETKNVPAIRAGPPAPNRAIRARMAVRADAAGHVSTSSHGTRRIRGLFWNAYIEPTMAPSRALANSSDGAIAVSDERLAAIGH